MAGATREFCKSADGKMYVFHSYEFHEDGTRTCARCGAKLLSISEQIAAAKAAKN